MLPLRQPLPAVRAPNHLGSGRNSTPKRRRLGNAPPSRSSAVGRKACGCCGRCAHRRATSMCGGPWMKRPVVSCRVKSEPLRCHCFACPCSMIRRAFLSLEHCDGHEPLRRPLARAFDPSVSLIQPRWPHRISPCGARSSTSSVPSRRASSTSKRLPGSAATLSALLTSTPPTSALTAAMPR